MTDLSIEKFSPNTNALHLVGHKNLAAGFFLVQLAFWYIRTNNTIKDTNGWVVKTNSDWSDELGLSFDQVKHAISHCKNLNLIQVKHQAIRGKSVRFIRIKPEYRVKIYPDEDIGYKIGSGTAALPSGKKTPGSGTHALISGGKAPTYIETIETNKKLKKAGSKLQLSESEKKKKKQKGNGMVEEDGYEIMGATEKEKVAAADINPKAKITNPGRLHKVWQVAWIKSDHGSCTPWTAKQNGQARNLIKKLSPERVGHVVYTAILGWQSCGESIKKDAGIWGAPDLPNIGHMLKYAQELMSWYEMYDSEVKFTQISMEPTPKQKTKKKKKEKLVTLEEMNYDED